MNRTAALVALALLSTRLAAAETPHAGTADPRMRWIEYQPDQVVRLTGVFRSATQILFGPGEEILHVALGDSISWEVAPVGGVLFLKPRERAGPTNLIVSTRQGATLRHYQFELTARAGAIGAQSPDTMFQIRFRYPDEDRARAATVQAEALERGVVRLALDHGVLEGPRNLRYSLQGASAIAPSEVSDNGRFTVMRFPGMTEIPAIFMVTPDGSESLVPFDVRDEFVVIHRIARGFRLRRGKLVTCISNDGPATYGIDPGTNTVSPEVDRITAPGATP